MSESIEFHERSGFGPFEMDWPFSAVAVYLTIKQHNISVWLVIEKREKRNKETKIWIILAGSDFQIIIIIIN